MPYYQTDTPRVVIAGVHSGVGKTTIVTGLLAALRARGLAAQSYKVGPDYIDPGYHQLATGRRAHNLDTWLMSPDEMVSVFCHTSQTCDIAVIEGVMGLFDGGKNGVSSTAAIAKLLKAPVILVIDAKSMGESAAAIVLGFMRYDPEIRLAGVIINRIGSPTHKTMVVEAITALGVPVLGALNRDSGLTLPERHLGLTPVEETDAKAVVELMRCKTMEQIDVPAIEAIAHTASSLAGKTVTKAKPLSVRIGVAQDAAFSFYYPESIQMLELQGAVVVPFSPLSDSDLPEVDGLLFGGGFPEMFAEQLASNMSMRAAVKRKASEGMPVYAECGGLMYLTKEITHFDGTGYPMAGVIPAVCSMQKRLETVGYVEATALQHTLLGPSGHVLRGHEFHFSRMQAENEADFPWAYCFVKARTGVKYSAGFASGNILASYLHIHFAGNPQAAESFVTRCCQYRNIRKSKG